jgi:hypothetical protein
MSQLSQKIKGHISINDYIKIHRFPMFPLRCAWDTSDLKPNQSIADTSLDLTSRIPPPIAIVRIRSVTDPGCLSRIQIFPIPDPRSRVKKIPVPDQQQRIKVFLTQKIVTKLLLSRMFITDPRSRIRIFSIPDPGVKESLDPGSGPATLRIRFTFMRILIRHFSVQCEYESSLQILPTKNTLNWWRNTVGTYFWWLGSSDPTGSTVSGSNADLDPGSGAFLTPGSGIRNRFFPNPGSQIHIFESLVTIFWVKSSIILWKLAPIFFFSTSKLK